ncbi:MAG: ABC transporter permease, partial [Acidobacteriaceae bacterium]|nr:ABC transporter permease [Acidobacteriaceae bacterium]
DNEFGLELESHLALLQERFERAGMSPDDARYAAERQLGGVTRLKENLHESRTLPLLETVCRDAKYAIRQLRKSPAFSMTALLTLALGIGATTAMFSVVNAVLLRPLPFRDPASLVEIYQDESRTGFAREEFTPANYLDCKTQNHVFETVVAVDENTYNLTGSSGEPQKLTGVMPTWDLFPLLGVKPLLGRVFAQGEDRPGNEHVVLIRYRLWRGRFGGDPRAVGREILLNGDKYTVIGVMPPAFAFPDASDDLWMPRAFTPEQLASRGEHYLWVVARLRPGVSLQQANTDLKILTSNLVRQYPEEMRFVNRFFAEPLQERYTRDARRGLTILLGAVGFILLIACANITNLLLSRAAARQHEIAVRRALGAERKRILRQLLTENLILATAAGCLGILVAESCFRFLAHLIPEDLTRTVSLSINLPMLSFALMISVVSSFLFGLAPALEASSTDLSCALKESGQGSAGSRHRVMGNLLFIGEVALCLFLLVASGLLIKSLVILRTIDPGFRSDHVLTMEISRSSVHDDLARRPQFFDAVLARVRALPDVRSAGFTSVLPFAWKGGMAGFVPEGAVLRPEISYSASDRVVTPGYFEAMRIPLRRGRLFDDHDDRPDAPPVAIINETMARKFWPGQDVIGKRLRFIGADPRSPWARIIGVVGDVRQMGLNEPPHQEMYFPHWQAVGNYMVPGGLAIRCGSDPLLLARAVTQVIHAIDPNQPVSDVTTLDDLLDREVAHPQIQAILLGSLAALALILANVGIYGVM